MRTDKIKNQIHEIKKWEEKTKRKYLKYETGKYKYDFQQYETVRFFGKCIYAGKFNVREAEIDQTNLLENMIKCNNKFRQKTKEGKNQKQNTFNSESALYEGRESTLNVFRNRIFPIKQKQGK